jgi:hypothetical protein
MQVICQLLSVVLEYLALAFQGSDGPSAAVEAMTDNPSSPLPSGQAPPLSLLFF